MMPAPQESQVNDFSMFYFGVGRHPNPTDGATPREEASRGSPRPRVKRRPAAAGAAWARRSLLAGALNVRKIQAHGSPSGLGISALKRRQQLIVVAIGDFIETAGHRLNLADGAGYDWRHAQP